MNEPKLLIGKNVDINTVRDFVLSDNFSLTDQETPQGRCRGTFIQKDDNSNFLKIVGWQKNISQLRKMTVNFPTIINLEINYVSKEITSIELDSSFKGSKGLMCSQKYLDENLKKVFIGKKFDNSILENSKVRDVHCFHLSEVINAMFSFYEIVNKNYDQTKQNECSFFEEEISDLFFINNDLYASSLYESSFSEKLRYVIKFKEIFSKIAFNKNGAINTTSPFDIEFYMNDQLSLRDSININNDESQYNEFKKFLFKCLRLWKYNVEKSDMRLLNTNLFPTAMIGIFVQAISVRVFRNNYNYIIHAITSIQRRTGIPLCVGAIKTKEESEMYFPDFLMDELI
jgi:hypothetical protein